jgi:hypothetical protein
MATDIQPPEIRPSPAPRPIPGNVATTSPSTPAGPPLARRSPRKLIVRLVVLLAVLGVAAFLIWRDAFQTYHLATVREGVLYRDGNRGIREFSNAVEQVRPKVVVSLISKREWNDPALTQFGDEVTYLKARKVKGRIPIRLERLYIELGGWPTKADVARFLEIVQNPKNQPVLVHCAQGVRRTGMMVAAYQQAVLGMSDQQAKDAILTFGHSDRTVADVKRFIDGYDPKTGAVPEGLPPSGEE